MFEIFPHAVQSLLFVGFTTTVQVGSITRLQPGYPVAHRLYLFELFLSIADEDFACLLEALKGQLIEGQSLR